MAVFRSTTPGRSEGKFSETVAYRTFVLYLRTRLQSTEAAFANGLTFTVRLRRFHHPKEHLFFSLVASSLHELLVPRALLRTETNHVVHAKLIPV